jgi:uncharacterized protein (UPF0332 family)
MNGRALLDPARRMASGVAEAEWRTAANRAYYALFLEARDALRRWGQVPGRRDQVHAFVRYRFIYPANPDLQSIGRFLDKLYRIRSEADYETNLPGSFASAALAGNAVRDAHDAIRLLDNLEADAGRLAAAIATIQATFPP